MFVARGLTPDDDELHPVRTPSEDWAETAWFAAAVPERGLGIWTYPFFRTGLGVMGCAVYVWGPGASELWAQPYYRQYWHLPVPEGLRLSAMTLSTGLSYRTLEPLTRYAIHYADGDQIRLDLDWSAVHPPHGLGVTDDVGHLDQFGRVTGELVLHGETIAIDCVEMRDRTWSPRRESRARTRLGYSYGAVGPDGARAFLCSNRRVADGTQALLGGFVLHHGVTTPLTTGERAVRRDAEGRPLTIELTISTAGGEAQLVRGEVVSRFAMHTSPYFVWVSMVRWTLPDGTTAWGEDQDTWSPNAWREAFPPGAGRPDEAVTPPA